jgi:uncharacterized protein
MLIFFAELVLGESAMAQTADLLPRGGDQPSFDCSAAKAASARLICADADLTRLDRELGSVFQRQKSAVYLPDQSRFTADELAWIRARNERCGLVGKNDAAIEVLASSKPCLLVAIQERIAVLSGGEQPITANQAPPPSSSVPAPPQATWRHSQQAPWPSSEPGSARQQPSAQQTAGTAKFEAAKQQGYRAISFEDFKLDGTQLSEAKAKLIMHGAYSKAGGVEILQPSGLAVAMAKQGYDDNFGVPLLTDDAARDVRKYFLNCSSNIAAQLGCAITVTGHADSCSATSLLETKNIACLVVEDGW